MGTLISKKKIKNEMVWSILSKGTTFVFVFLMNIFFARYLGPELFGAWSYFFSILSILLLISYMGINASSRKFIAQYNGTDNLRSVLKASIKIRFIYSVSFALLFLFTHKYIAAFLSRPDFEILFLTAIPVVIFAGFVEYFKHVFQGLHRLKYAFYITFFEHGFKLVITVIFLFIINNLIAIVYAFSMAYLLTLIVGFYFYYFIFYRKQIFVDCNFSKEIFYYSIPLFFISIGTAIAVELDVVMIGLLSVDSEVGIYAVAKQIIVKLPHIALAISLGTMPVFAKFNTKNKEELSRLFKKLLVINTKIFGTIGLIILTTGWFFIPLIFGEEYIGSVVPLMILVFYLILSSYSIFLSSFLDYQGLAKKRAINLSVAIIANIILNLILIPRFGATGAAIGTSVSYSPYVLLNWFEVKKILNIGIIRK